jgi:hypothetical protein
MMIRMFHDIEARGRN